MKAIALPLGALLTAGATGALAQWDNRPYPYHDPRNGTGWGENRWQWREEPPARYYDNRRYWDERAWRGQPHECWNWQANTWEVAREGEYQDDLDYGRCRPVRYAYREGYRYYRY